MSSQVKKITISAFFLALGLVLPFAFHSFGPGAGAMFLPMHIPVLLCGFVCGSGYGALIGVLTPLVSSALTGMPVFMPTGIAMCFELMTYGILSGLIVKRLPLYPSLIITMLAGRAVSGIVNLILLSMAGKAYTLEIFLTAAFVTALLGIILQLIIIPLLVKVIEKIEIHKE
ncbi:MAG: ECF transporter S component [Clostridium sp.]